jgi:hypothetical protein
MMMIKLREHHQNGAPLSTKHKNLNSLYLVATTKLSHATVFHDRIYSLLGLIHEEDNIQDLAPDYSKSATQVYKEFFKHVVEGSKSLMILAFARFDKHHLKDLPSWVPEWSEDTYSINKILYTRPFSGMPDPLAGRHSSLFKPTLDVPIQFGFSASMDILYIHGCPFDIVASVEEFIHDGIVWTKPVFLELICKWGKPALEYSGPHPYTGEEPLYTAFARTLIADIDPDNDTSPARKEYEVPVKVMNQFPDNDDLWRNHFVSGYQNAMAGICGCRRFFFTRKGYMGLGPPNVKVGDEIALLFGGPTPYVLRDDSHGFYQYIGEVYVHGIMHGEAMKDSDIKMASREFSLC